ncbi:hypothetical protein BW730_14635 [Tessaracoccus aquimaris]|uniref:Uncharacterized protein n=1 Tax=Tessaracoccus aquimaris TaxID=1332264 RepID=A0A1Q2CR07_9ACTN|nr:hypothetical protein [Tessaracoccus aquimaris]AQP48553.1 hypothetical protein BW730_14635 [Tessaracoccus aquimaris]
MNITHQSTTPRSSPDTVIVVPSLDRLPWRDRWALRLSLWVIERTVHPSQPHLDAQLWRASQREVARRETASLHWLPPR